MKEVFKSAARTEADKLEEKEERLRKRKLRLGKPLQQTATGKQKTFREELLKNGNS